MIDYNQIKQDFEKWKKGQMNKMPNRIFDRRRIKELPPPAIKRRPSPMSTQKILNVKPTSRNKWGVSLDDMAAKASRDLNHLMPKIEKINKLFKTDTGWGIEVKKYTGASLGPFQGPDKPICLIWVEERIGPITNDDITNLKIDLGLSEDVRGFYE